MSLLAKMAPFLAALGIDCEKPEDRQRYQVAKRQTRYTYNQGPMYYLGQQIVKRMQDAGWPAKIYYSYRTPQEQARLYAKGRTTKGPKVTDARPYQSPHNYYEAVDIVHSDLYWNAPREFWDTLQAVAKVVQEEYDCTFKMGADWGDYAHIELKDWRTVRDATGKRPPTPKELDHRFEQVLPKVWARRPVVRA